MGSFLAARLMSFGAVQLASNDVIDGLWLIHSIRLCTIGYIQPINQSSIFISIHKSKYTTWTETVRRNDP